MYLKWNWELDCRKHRTAEMQLVIHGKLLPNFRRKTVAKITPFTKRHGSTNADGRPAWPKPLRAGLLTLFENPADQVGPEFL